MSSFPRYEVLPVPRCPRRDKYEDVKALGRWAEESGHVEATNMAHAFDLYLAKTPFVIVMNPNGKSNGLCVYSHAHLCLSLSLFVLFFVILYFPSYQ